MKLEGKEFLRGLGSIKNVVVQGVVEYERQLRIERVLLDDNKPSAFLCSGMTRVDSLDDYQERTNRPNHEFASTTVIEKTFLSPTLGVNGEPIGLYRRARWGPAPRSQNMHCGAKIAVHQKAIPIVWLYGV